ncbi:hypothetical protein SAMN05216480_10524 [Pustulibacterium marinum]|uniref:Uncharacterized protein n=1 Tax=Pustulibacterium marinum TaxID=1224947 RepID=A0A1I7GK94_9FLAO|nr:hypothetical protein [Pustulibacterium marinum]SFU48870.1 hypothetical protein SAMN05216480_10524 [Pustulibacterium marinum]
MTTEKQPTKIRSHLVAFFFKEMLGKEAHYHGKTAKSIKILPASSIGRILNLYYRTEYEEKEYFPFLIYITHDEKLAINQFKGVVYVEKNGVKSYLRLSEESSREVNNFLEDWFRISFVYYVDGFKSGKNMIAEAINCWIDKYELLEHGFSYETLRMLYYREKKKNANCGRLQYKIGNRILNYQ